MNARPIFLGLFCLAVATSSVDAQANPPEIPRWAATVHQLALKVKDTGKKGLSPGVFPPIIPKYFHARIRSALAARLRNYLSERSLRMHRFVIRPGDGVGLSQAAGCRELALPDRV